MRPRLPHGHGLRVDISIHAPREGCDPQAAPGFVERVLFQSTHPVRGATMGNQAIMDMSEFQSTHPVRGATKHGAERRAEALISIHAPREGCDGMISFAPRRTWYFNPRTP